MILFVGQADCYLVKMKLTMEQATAIRDDFKYLEGRSFIMGGSERTVKSVVIGPYGQKLEAFMQAFKSKNYSSWDSKEILVLATLGNPDSYSVYIFYNDVMGVGLYESFFTMINEIDINIDLEQYGLS